MSAILIKKIVFYDENIFTNDSEQLNQNYMKIYLQNRINIFWQIWPDRFMPSITKYCSKNMAFMQSSGTNKKIASSWKIKIPIIGYYKEI